MQTPRLTTVYQSLHRHNHLLGAEQDLVMLSALVAFMLAMSGLTLVGIISALIFWVFAIFGLRKMAKHDPIMSKVFLRHIKQQGYYSAKSSHWRRAEGYKVK